MLKKFAFLVLFLCSLSASAESIRLGVHEYALSGAQKELIDRSAAQLSEALAPVHTLKVKAYSDSDLRRAIELHEVDLFLAASEFYRQMIRKGAKDLVSIQTANDRDPNKTDGIALLINGDRDDMTSLQSLEGKRVVYASDNPVMVLNILKRELKDRGLEPKGFFKEISAADTDPLALLKALEKNVIDGLILPVCTLERITESAGINTSWLRALEQRHFSSLQCIHSSYLYPGDTLASLPSLRPGLSKKITDVLLGMGVQGQEVFWNVPTDFSETDRLLRTLDIDAWAEDRKWTLAKVISEYWQILLALAVIVLSLLTYSSMVSYAVNNRTKRLRAALKREQTLMRKSIEASRKIEEMQRIGAFSQLSSLFAHELGQPLYAIRCFCYTLQRSLNRDTDSNKTLLGLVEDIEGQAVRADEIVQRTRNFIKGRKGCVERIEINGAVANAVETFKVAQPGAFNLQLSGTNDSLYILGDPLDIDLIIINLLRNAYEACSSNSQVRIWVSVAKGKRNTAEIAIWDNGPSVSEEILKSIREKSQGVKQNGLGVGLKIVASLSEVLGGKIELGRSSLGGLVVRIIIPTIGNSADE